MEDEKNPVQEEAAEDAKAEDIIVRCRQGGIMHLATMMSVVQKWIAAGLNVELHSVETDEAGGVMIAMIDGLMVYAEVPLK